MPRTPKECEELFGGQIWTTIKRAETEFVFRWPDPDAFDEGFGAMVTAKNTGDFKHAIRAFEIIVKASCCSHNAAELDALRRVSPPSNYGLFQELGPKLFALLAPEAKGRKKD